MFDNFIIPLKESKALTDLIIKLLTFYYQDDRVQEIVDEGLVSEDKEVEQKRSEMYENINQSLAYLEFLSEEGKNVLGDGADTMESILAGAEKTGMATHEENELGEEYTKFVLETPKAITDKSDNPESKEEPVNNSKVEKLENEMSELRQMVLGIKEMFEKLTTSNTVSESVSEVKQEKEDIDVTEPTPTEVIEDSSEIVYEKDEDDGEESDVVESDASDDMLALLESL